MTIAAPYGQFTCIWDGEHTGYYSGEQFSAALAPVWSWALHR